MYAVPLRGRAGRWRERPCGRCSCGSAASGSDFAREIRAEHRRVRQQLAE